MGRPFAAILKLSGEHKLEFDFGQNDDDAAASETVDFSDKAPLGACPKCTARVFEHGMSYVCERSVGPDRNCDFRSGKVILQQEITEAQMKKLLTEGRTDLLDGFVSSRTRRKFKAFLVPDASGKIGFEFAPRPVRPGATGKKAAASDDGAPTPAPDGAAPASKTARATGAARTRAQASTSTDAPANARPRSSGKTAGKKATRQAR